MMNGMELLRFKDYAKAMLSDLASANCFPLRIDENPLAGQQLTAIWTDKKTIDMDDCNYAHNNALYTHFARMPHQLPFGGTHAEHFVFSAIIEALASEVGLTVLAPKERDRFFTSTIPDRVDISHGWGVNSQSNPLEFVRLAAASTDKLTAFKERILSLSDEELLNICRKADQQIAEELKKGAIAR